MSPTPRAGLGLRGGYHSPQLDVDVRLNTNESPFRPSKEFYERFAARIRHLSLNRYPDRNYSLVREALGNHLGVSPEEIFVGNGSNEVLLNLALAYGGPDRKAVVFEPTYSLHSSIASKTGTQVESFMRNESYLIELDASNIAEVRTADLVFACSPNNPTGMLEPEDTLSILARESSGLVIRDEAYSDFLAKEQRTPRKLQEAVVSVRTLSKWYALAGLRAGYCRAHPSVISVLDEVVLPYHLDQVKQAGILTALEMQVEFDVLSASLVAEREYLVKELSSLGVVTLPSSANFLLMLLPGLDASRLWGALVARSVLIRDTSGWPGLESSLRVSVGTHAENTRFIEALAQVLESWG